jgi:phage terminase large subunit-like protein
MEWSTACPDWEDRLKAKLSIIPPPIFPDQAEQALRIFKQLRVCDLPKSIWDESLGEQGEYRSPNFGECSEQWVFDFVAAIFGGYDAETGQQLIREYYLLISKKNTKSTIAAGIMLTAVILCWRNEEEHLILAPTKEVADNSFKPAAAMVRADDELMALFHVQDHVRTITHLVSKASLKVVAADTDTVSGKKSGKVLVDEHWLFGKRANAEAMFMEALGGQVSRDEGWVIFLTTQSDEPPAGVFKEKLNYYRDVRDGKIDDPKSLGVLYEYPAAMVKAKAYLDSSTYYLTNPNIDRSVSAAWLADQLKKLLHKTDGTLQIFLAKHLNVQIGMNLRADRWAGADFWERQAKVPGITLHELLARCEVVTAGIDGGGLDDLLGLAFVGRERVTGKWLAWTRAWAHPIAMERRKSEESKYDDFKEQGDLVIIEQLPGDVAAVAAVVKEVNESGLLASVGLDPEKTHKVMFQALVDAEIDEKKCFGVSQGWKLIGAISVTERKLAEGVLLHGGQPLMNWCVSNAKIEPKGNAALITKQASGTGKIDPLMALFNAVQLMALNPEPAQTTSIYDEGVTI